MIYAGAGFIRGVKEVCNSSGSYRLHGRVTSLSHRKKEEEGQEPTSMV